MTNLAGHDLESLIEAFDRCGDDQPTLFIAYTIKGFGLPFAGHKDNHAGLMNPTQFAALRESMGVREGCEILSAIGRDLKIPVTTDVHLPAEAEIAGEKIDMLQIPAFLCRQTDLLRAAAETGRAINVKKGQFLAPWDLRNIAEKLIAFGNEQFCFTERGTSFGYNNLVADMRSLYWLRDAGYRVIFDATHSVQRPGAAGDSTSGDGVLAPALARAAMATGCDGIFMEVHENPARALSDGPNQIPLKHLPKQLRVLKAIHAAVSGRGD